MNLLNALGDGRFGQGLQKLLAMTGTGAVQTLGPELIPVAVALPAEFEHYFLRNEHFFAGSLILNGGATSAQVQLRNPANTNTLIIVEAWEASLNAAGNINVSSITTPGAGWTPIGAMGNLDMRGGARRSVGLREGQNSNTTGGAGAVAATIKFGPSSGAQPTFNSNGWKHVLPPGTALNFISLTVANNLIVQVLTREVPFYPEFESSPA